MLTMMAVLQDGGIGLSQILRDIPHDGPSFVVYSLLLLFGAGIWLGSRRKKAAK